MIPEIGHIFLISAMVFAFAGGVFPAVGIFKKNAFLISAYKPLIISTSIFALLSFLMLVYSFSKDDFSLLYIATNSNTNLPFYYKLAATWGAHEGSLLLWISVLCLWSLAYFFKTRQEEDKYRCLTFVVLSQIIFSFISFTIFTSNPFERILPISPVQGVELNPLLQDFAFTIHPPLLYAGYSGLSIPFAIVISALLTNSNKSIWARQARSWTLLSCSFLTLGICLGSWWAYYELGWGGWWFWDPVENVAFVPWLISVALFHSLLVTDKRGFFINWSILLTIMAFASCLLGTFLVRSGILTSVHSFALDPERGVYLLIIFGYFIFSSLTIYALKSKARESNQSYSLYSKEFGLLLNNLLLVILALSILFGTFFPLIYEGVTNGKQISVGAPYYEILILPFAAGLALLQGLALFLGWNATEDQSFIKRILIETTVIFIVYNILVYVFLGEITAGAFVSGLMFCWIVAGNLIDSFVLNLKSSHLYKAIIRRFSLILSHTGTAVLILGVGIVSSYSLENEIKLSKGEVYSFGEYQLSFEDISMFNKKNYESEMAIIGVTDMAGRKMAPMFTEKRFYPSAKQVTSEAAIKSTIFHDLYVTLGDDLGKGDWSFRIQIKPFVRWIWFGAIMIALGTCLASLTSMKRKE